MYDQKKERDRQELIHMGDRLDTAWDNYEETTKQLEEDKALAEEFTDLMIQIVDGKVPQSKLKDATAKMC